MLSLCSNNAQHGAVAEVDLAQNNSRVQPVRAAVDIGGTFTDVQLFDGSSGTVCDFKAPTTPEDPSIGLVAALNGAAARAGIAPSAISLILHGSTIATNAVLERRLPKGALLTTKGFTDVLAIGRHMRSDVYGLLAEPRPVLIPADRRVGISERVRADGTVETHLDPKEVLVAGRRLRDSGVEAIAIVFLHAFRNPVHEQMAVDVLSGIPGLSVTSSHETSPEIREYERASTAVLNALLKPVMSAYLERVEDRLVQAGIQGRLFLVQSNGGVATPEEAARLPVRMVLSGPSGGAMALADLAQRHATENVVGLDMGGTSTDVSVLQSGRVEETMAGEIDGLPVRLPMVEIRTIGAGGGSLARGAGGALSVGPESAGAVPGPACYGRGGTEPTVTDANLHLGLIDPAGFLGGAMVLDRDAAQTAIGTVADALDLSADKTAAGIVRIANVAMAGAVRLSLFEKGLDPADFTLAAFGGAGGLHACAVAEELDIRQVFFPAMASTLSARGILASDLRHDLIRAQLMLADDPALPILRRLVQDLCAEGQARLERDGVPPDRRRIEIVADMRYRGQAFEIMTPWDAATEAVDATTLAGLRERFHSEHEARYAHSAPGEAVEIVALRAKVLGLLERPSDASLSQPKAASSYPAKDVLIDGSPRQTDVCDRSEITEVARHGPLLIQEDYSVLWVQPGWSVRALAGGDLVATYENEGRS